MKKYKVTYCLGHKDSYYNDVTEMAKWRIELEACGDYEAYEAAVLIMPTNGYNLEWSIDSIEIAGGFE